MESDELIPVMTDKNAAPDKILKVIHCNCLGGCKSAQCSCRRYAACGPCQVDNCDNPNNTQEVDTEEEEDDIQN